MCDTPIQADISMPGIKVDANANSDFFTHVQVALLSLQLGPQGVGEKLIKDIGKAALSRENPFDKNYVTIREAQTFSGPNGSTWAEEELVIRWYPHLNRDTADEDQLCMIPPFIILGHELIHALHSFEGTSNLGKNNKDSTVIDECRTIGLGYWSDDRITENKLRDEWNLRKRTDYMGCAPEKVLIGTGYENYKKSPFCTIL